MWHGPFKRATLEAVAEALTTIARGGTLGNLPTSWLHVQDDSSCSSPVAGAG
ncbi:hypothetical protein ACFQ0B_78240 [Nonomuraea thailandensis]